MKNIIGVYFSGTGNTRHCVNRLLKCLDDSAQSFSIEDEAVIEQIKSSEFIILGYSVRYSNLPLMVRHFILDHADLWAGKKVLCLATMGLFSGDGAGCSARLLKKCGATVVGGIHLKMPDSVCDAKALKRSLAVNQQLVKDADAKIEQVAEQIKQGCYPKEGIGLAYRMAGLFGQRLWFLSKGTKYANNLKFSDACIGCGLCAAQCPMKNLTMENQRPVQHGQCTKCYRCLNHCPKQAITLIGKNVVEQCSIEKYI